VVNLSPGNKLKEKKKKEESISYYAFFKLWLLLSQNFDEKKETQSLNPLKIHLGTLIIDEGCFPLGYKSYHL